MTRGGYQPFQSGQWRQPGMTLSAMLKGSPQFLPNPIGLSRNGQTLARLLLTGQRWQR